MLKDEIFFSTGTPDEYKTQDALNGTMSVYNTVIHDSGRVVQSDESVTVQTITITRTLQSTL